MNDEICCNKCWEWGQKEDMIQTVPLYSPVEEWYHKLCFLEEEERREKTS